MSDMSEEQAEEFLRNFSEGKANLHSFFTNVVKAKNTTKTGNLTQDELGLPKLPFRTYKELALFSRDVGGDEGWASYFDQMAEIQTSSSLSKDATLLKLAGTIRKELADVSPGSSKKDNPGWFKTGKNKQV